MAPRSRLGPLLLNLSLSVAVAALLLGGLEATARWRESRRPPKEKAEYLWDWEERWDGDFYTVGSNAAGWPVSQEWNADGLRDRARPRDRLSGTWRVAVLGDSVTLGAGIKASEAFPQVLEARLEASGQAVEVMNVALWGWSTRQERLAYERIARAYRPDQVIVAVCLNDIAELQNNLGRPAPWLAGLFRRSALARAIVNAEGREIGNVEELFRDAGSARVKQGYARLFEELEALRAEVQRDGATFAVLLFPFRFQVEPGAPPELAQRTIAEGCASRALVCHDLLPALAPLGPSGFVDYDHLSPTGAAAAAEAIESSGLLPARPVAASLPGAADTVDALIEALRASEPERRAAAARALGARGAAAAQALPALFETLADPREAVRFDVAQALDRIGPGPADEPALEAVLRHGDPYVRAFGAYALGGLGPAAAPAVPALIDAYRREEGEGRGTAVGALGQLGPLAKQAVPALVAGLRNPVNHRRWASARALGRIGPEARAAVSALAGLVADPNNHVRVHAAQALGRIGPDAAEAVPALLAAGRDEDAAVRREAALALSRIRGLPPAR